MNLLYCGTRKAWWREEGHLHGAHVVSNIGSRAGIYDTHHTNLEFLALYYHLSVIPNMNFSKIILNKLQYKKNHHCWLEIPEFVSW